MRAKTQKMTIIGALLVCFLIPLLDVDAINDSENIEVEYYFTHEKTSTDFGYILQEIPGTFYIGATPVLDDETLETQLVDLQITNLQQVHLNETGPYSFEQIGAATYLQGMESNYSYWLPLDQNVSIFIGGDINTTDSIYSEIYSEDFDTDAGFTATFSSGEPILYSPSHEYLTNAVEVSVATPDTNLNDQTVLLIRAYTAASDWYRSYFTVPIDATSPYEHLSPQARVFFYKYSEFGGTVPIAYVRLDNVTDGFDETTLTWNSQPALTFEADVAGSWTISMFNELNHNLSVGEAYCLRPKLPDWFQSETVYSTLALRCDEYDSWAAPYANYYYNKSGSIAGAYVLQTNTTETLTTSKNLGSLVGDLEMNDLIQVGFKATGSNAIFLNVGNEQFSLVEDGNTNFAWQTKWFTLDSDIVAAEADFTIEGDFDAETPFYLDNITIKRPTLPTLYSLMDIQVAGTPYTETLNFTNTNLEPLAQDECVLSFNYTTGSGDFEDWDQENDAYIAAQNLTVWFAFQTDTTHTINCTYQWGVSTYKTPSEIELTANGAEIIDASRNSGYCSFNSFQNNLTLDCNLDTYTSFMMISYLTATHPLMVMSKTYLRDTFTLETAHALTLYEIHITNAEGILHLYVNGQDLGAVNETTCDIEIEPGAPTKIEVVLTDETYIPLIPIIQSLGDGTYSYYTTGRFNALSYSDRTRFSEFSFSLPDGFTAQQTNLTFSTLSYQKNYTSSSANDTRSSWRESPNNPLISTTVTDDFSQFPHQNATINTNTITNQTYPASPSIMYETFGQNEIFTILGDENNASFSDIVNGTETGAIAATHMSDDDYYEITSDFSDESGHYQALYSFKGDTDDAPPPGWDITGDNGATLTARVDAETDGHKKNFKMHDSTTGGGINADLIFDAQASGTISFYTRISTTSPGDSFCFYGQDASITTYWALAFWQTGSGVYAYDDSVSNWVQFSTYAADTWYRVVIDFQGGFSNITFGSDTATNYQAPGANDGTVARFRAITWSGTRCDAWIDALDFSWSDGFYASRNTALDNSTELDAALIIQTDLDLDTIKNFTLTYEVMCDNSILCDVSLYNSFTTTYQTITSLTLGAESTDTISQTSYASGYFTENGSAYQIALRFYNVSENLDNSIFTISIDYIQLHIAYYNASEISPLLSASFSANYTLNETKIIHIYAQQTAFSITNILAWNNITTTNETIGSGAGPHSYTLDFSYALNLTVSLYAVDENGKTAAITITNLSIYDPGILPDVTIMYSGFTVVNTANDIGVTVSESEYEVAGIWVFNNVTLTNTSIGSGAGTFHYYYSNNSAQNYQVIITVTDTHAQSKIVTIDHLAIIYNATRPSAIINQNSPAPLGTAIQLNISAAGSLAEVIAWNNITASNTTLGLGAGNYQYEIESEIPRNATGRLYLVDEYGFTITFQIDNLTFTKLNTTLDFTALAKHYYFGDDVDASTDPAGTTLTWYAPDATQMYTTNTTLMTNATFEPGWYHVLVEFNSTTYFNISRAMSFELLPLSYSVNSTDVNLTVNGTPVINNVITVNHTSSISISSLDNCSFDLSISIVANNSGTGTYSNKLDFAWEFNQTDNFSAFTITAFNLTDIPSNFTHYYFDSTISDDYTLSNDTLTINEAVNRYIDGAGFEVTLSLLSETINREQQTSTTLTTDSSVEFESIAYTNRSYEYFFWDPGVLDIASLSITHDHSAMVTRSFNTAGGKYFFEQDADEGDTFTINEFVNPHWAINPTWISNNGTYTKISVAYSAALEIENVTMVLSLGTTLNENWTTSQSGVSFEQLNASFTLYVNNLTVTNTTQTITIEGTSSVPVAAITNYTNGVGCIAEGNEFEFNAFLSYPRYSQTYFIPIESTWAVYSLEYGTNNYSVQTTGGYAFVSTGGLDPSINNSYLYFTADPLSIVTITREGNQFVIYIESTMNLTETYFLYAWGDDRAHSLSSENDSISSLGDKNLENFGVPDGYLFFLYDVREGGQYIIIDIDFTSPLELLASGIPIFIVAGIMIAWYYTDKKYGWMARIGNKIPDRIKEKFTRDPDEIGATELQISTKGDKIIVKAK